jgi:hypothetical protein
MKKIKGRSLYSVYPSAYFIFESNFCSFDQIVFEVTLNVVGFV